MFFLDLSVLLAHCMFFFFFYFFFFKQKTAYEMRISDWSSDVCSSDLSTPYRSKIGAAPAYSSIGGAVFGMNVRANSCERAHSIGESMRMRSTLVPSRSRRMRIDSGR